MDERNLGCSPVELVEGAGRNAEFSKDVFTDWNVGVGVQLHSIYVIDFLHDQRLHDHRNKVLIGVWYLINRYVVVRSCFSEVWSTFPKNLTRGLTNLSDESPFLLNLIDSFSLFWIACHSADWFTRWSSPRFEESYDFSMDSRFCEWSALIVPNRMDGSIYFIRPIPTVSLRFS